MKIANNYNMNFGALLGKKEVVTRYYKDRCMKIRTFQHVYPFKDMKDSIIHYAYWIKTGSGKLILNMKLWNVQ